MAYQNEKLSENFHLSEFLISQTATRKGIDNYPTAQHLQNLKDSTTHLWQPVRELLGQPMLISSGYRSPALNKAVGGSKTSAHPFGRAIDFTAPKFGTPRQIVSFLTKEFKEKGIKFDQIILEFDRWVHLGYKSPTGQQRGQVLTAKKVNGRTQYFNGIV